MAIINRHVQARLDNERVKIFFVSGKVTKWYNAQRTDPKTEVCLLGGWYWAHADFEGGPFRTSSGALRDPYYRRILHVMPPALNERDMRAAEKNLKRQEDNARATTRDYARPKIRVSA